MATHRRQFLKAAAASGIAAPCLVQAAAASLEAAGNPAAGPGNPTREVLITSAETPLGQILARGLGSTYRLRLTGRTTGPGQTAVRLSDLGADDSTRSLVRGTKAIVHLLRTSLPSSVTSQIDHATRCTYNLLQAAAQEGVQHLICLSSLAVMAGYAEDLVVDEDWRPSPGDRSPGLADYLGEVVCREFAREKKVHVVVLRSGRVVQAREIAGLPFDPLWVEQDDMVQAVLLALRAQLDSHGPRLGAWSVLHILSGKPQGRFPISKAQRLLGYKPRFPEVQR
jgi:nucleoside-diphosphate-sugar epimerase